MVRALAHPAMRSRAAMFALRLRLQDATVSPLLAPPTSVRAGRALTTTRAETPMALQKIAARPQTGSRVPSLRRSKTAAFPPITMSEALPEARSRTRIRPHGVIGTRSLLHRMREECRSLAATPLRARILVATSLRPRAPIARRVRAATPLEHPAIRNSTRLLPVRAAIPRQIRAIADLKSPARTHAATRPITIARHSICTSRWSSLAATALQAIGAVAIALPAIAEAAATAHPAPADLTAAVVAGLMEAVADLTEVAAANKRLQTIGHGKPRLAVAFL